MTWNEMTMERNDRIPIGLVKKQHGGHRQASHREIQVRQSQR